MAVYGVSSKVFRAVVYMHADTEADVTASGIGNDCPRVFFQPSLKAVRFRGSITKMSGRDDGTDVGGGSLCRYCGHASSSCRTCG